MLILGSLNLVQVYGTVDGHEVDKTAAARWATRPPPPAATGPTTQDAIVEVRALRTLTADAAGGGVVLGRRVVAVAAHGGRPARAACHPAVPGTCGVARVTRRALWRRTRGSWPRSTRRCGPAACTHTQLWPRVFAKVTNEVFDAGSVFSFDEDGSLVVSAEEVGRGGVCDGRASARARTCGSLTMRGPRVLGTRAPR